MASEKVTEVEMEKITPAEDRESSDTEHEKVRETKDEKEPEEKGKEKEEDSEETVYSKLNSPTEDIYSLAGPTFPAKHDDVYRKVTFYRRLSAILLLLCVVLLAVLLALAVKLSEAKSRQACPMSGDVDADLDVDVERTTVAGVCSRQECQAMYPQELTQDHNGRVCTECGKGWLKFEGSCYFLSQTRLSWLASREECKKKGGDLVVISSERVQRFLTQKGLMLYWIGLSRFELQQWTWINNTALMNSYWAGSPEGGDCVFLSAGRTPRRNWYSNPCTALSHYICQRA